MRARHVVTLGICVGVAGAGALFVGCGTDTFGTCADKDTCASEGGVEGGLKDGTAGDTGGGGEDSGGHPEGSTGEGGGKDGGDGGVLPEAGCSAPTTLECSGSCVDPGLPSHCGTCTNVCSGPEAGAGAPTCTNGVCTVGCDADGSTPLNCSGACVDPTQPTHCGDCATNCAGPKSQQGQATCNLDGGTPLDAGGDGGPCGFTCNAGNHACGLDCLSDTDDPSTDPCVVSDTTGVFVAPAPLGSASGDGSKENPLLTVTAGITKAMQGKKRVYVCLGTYSEQLALTGTDDGLTVYGGLDCTNGWAYVGSTPSASTVVATPSSAAAPGTALTVTGPMTTGVVFQDVGFTAIDGKVAGDSSVAVFATTQAKLSLTRGTVTAGKGVTGTGGGTNSNWSGTATSGSTPSTIFTGGGGGAISCNDSTSSAGGPGGGCSAGACSTGEPGSSAPPIGSPLNNGGSASTTVCAADGAGSAGGGGGVTTQVGPGATSTGTVSASGWVNGGAGGPGANGEPAQGGGGGGGALAGGAGAGGGSGGCGGGRGLGGGPGGSSVGVLVYQAAFVASSITLVTVNAGTGGSGGAGQAGQGGGGGGPALNGSSCPGGPGGSGSAGTGGGGGAGGNSVGVAWLGSVGPSLNGTVVTSDQTTFTGFTTGTAGVAGPGGKDGNSNPSGGPGAAGSANAVEQFH